MVQRRSYRNVKQSQVMPGERNGQQTRNRLIHKLVSLSIKTSGYLRILMFSEMTLHRPGSLGASGPEGLEPKFHSIQFNSPSEWLSTTLHHIPEDQHPHLHCYNNTTTHSFILMYLHSKL